MNSSTTARPSQTRTLDRHKILRFTLRRGPLILFGTMLLVLAIGSPTFLSLASISSTLVQASPIAIVAFGLAIVVMGGGDDVVAGGIDLSIPASAALATAIISDQLTNHGATFTTAFLLGFLAAVAVGCVNALLVTVIGMTSILATLATYVSVVGVIRVLTSNRRINVTDPVILFIRDERILGVPIPVVVMLLTFAVIAFVMHRTKYGMQVQAVGGNMDAAASSGLRTQPLIASTFVFAGVAASIAAVLLVARGSGTSPGIDERLLVDMVLATFVGAAFSRRNVVTVFGALIGGILVAFMSTGLILNRVDNSWVDGWKGLLILLVVVSAALQGRSRR